MKAISSRAMALVLSGAVLVSCGCAGAQTVIQDGFESGGFNPGWDLTSGVTVQTTGGASNTAKCATLAAYSATTGRELEARFTDTVMDGAEGFYVDFHFRVRNTAERQFNFHIAVTDTATINLRYQAAWAAYNGSAWQSISDLGGVAAGQWHRMRVTGYNWGKTGARYDLQLSDAGGTNFTSTVTNLAIYHSGNPETTTARLFRFISQYGNCPGFDVDEVIAEITAAPPTETNAILNISGTYPHLTVFSGSGEIGMGAVVPWADKLWFVTYPPHNPNGGSDKLWTLDTNLVLTPHPSSVGGTHANRLIHRESQQLNIGPYFIGTNGGVRVIPPAQMPGRLTGSARHLDDPTNKVYIASMEEGFYEVDVNTLAVKTLHPDVQGGGAAQIPGYHGKGLYSGQGRVLYSNNGEPGWSIGSDPGFNSSAGALLENLGGTDFTNGWNTVERKTFTEITGPGGIYGPENANDPIWATGWDKRSVILKVLDRGHWHTYRLPKGSYTHDAFHGWFTEWPRIREIADGKLLMHMHGLFYDFPKTFRAAQTGGLRPICTYLRMPVDYCWWNGQLVMGRDDASTTGGNNWAGQSHSAPWFGQLSDLGQWGAPAGFGGPWKEDEVAAGAASEPFLVTGFAKRVLHLRHTSGQMVNFAVQYDANGDGTWKPLATVAVPANGYAWYLLPPALSANWVRLVSDRDATGVTAYFHLANPPATPVPGLFAGIADIGATNRGSEGIIRPQGGDARTLQFAATLLDDTGALAETAYYEIGGAFILRRATNTAAESTLRATYGLATADFAVDDASVVYTEGANRFRLPKNHAAYDTAFGPGWPRGRREVVTERDLFNAHGTFYELPKPASGGFRRVRPVCTHNKRITDFASWRGLFAVAGTPGTATDDGHFFRSEDGRAGLWFGNVDDLWRLGAPRGTGGPWRTSAVTANSPSDPYLMFGYEHKALELSHQHVAAVTFVVEVDFAADNTWGEYARFTVSPGQSLKHVFPAGYSAHWVRLKADVDTVATATFTYGPAAPNQAFIDWSEENQLAPAASAGELMARDDDGDAWANWVEFLQGSNPKTDDRGSFPPSYAVKASNLLYEIVTRYGEAATSGVTQVSTDLRDWLPVPPEWEVDGPEQNGVPPGFWRRLWQIPMREVSQLFLRHQLPPAGVSVAPNIVFILTDDQRFDALGAAGNPLIRTPNLDVLAARGVRFANAFVTCSICSPSRAAVLTGRYGSATGVTTLDRPINAAERTIAHRLREAGYATGIIGKWHLGNEPVELGFDTARFFRSNGAYYGRNVNLDGQTVTVPGFIEDWIAAQSLTFVDSAMQRNRPFFLWMCTQVPHLDHEMKWPAKSETLALYAPPDMPLPSTWNDLLTGRPPYLAESRFRTQALSHGYDQPENIRAHWQHYYAVITELDAALGRVLEGLAYRGISSNTWVILMGDNGWFLGEHGFTSKVLPYEESIRVPMLVAGPGITAATNQQLVLNVDLAATILDIAGVSVPNNLHGRSLLPLARGQSIPWRDHIYYEAPTPALGSWPLLAVRTDRWKYVRTYDLADPQQQAFEELYDLAIDTLETNNLAADPAHTEQLAQLRALLDQDRAQIGP